MKTVVSFVHGYEKPDFPVSAGAKAALAVVEGGAIHDIVQFEFLRTPDDFDSSHLSIRGEGPLNLESFQPLPRFGLTGLHREDDFIYAGSWNGIYRIDTQSFEVESFVTNRLTADIHGLHASEQLITTTLPPIDGVVQTGVDGTVVRAYSVAADLSVSEIRADEQPDWRFLGKQMRGPLGVFHFNAVEVEHERIWLTSRNLGCYVSFVPGDSMATIHAIAHMTPVMMHDGVPFRDLRYATSVDGKILLHSNAASSSHESYSKYISGDGEPKFQAGICSLSESVVRIDDALGRQTNWCRGLEVDSRGIVTTVDGRYGSGNKFSVVEMSHDGILVAETPIRWQDVGDPHGLRYVTGFDVCSV